jgi:hypothetical protein
MRKTLPLIIGLLLFAANTRADNSLLFPRLQKSAQSAALGDGASALSGINALGMNPAGLSTESVEILTQMNTLMADSRLTMAGAALPLNRRGMTLGFSYMDLQSASIQRRDSYGVLSGTYKTQDSMMEAALSVPLSLGVREDAIPHVSPLLLGLGVKRLQFRIDNRSASTTALDLGIRYSLSSMPVTLGASYLNMGKGVTLYQKESPLPRTAVLSVAVHPAASLQVVGSYQSFLADDRSELSIGTELAVGSRFTLRGRYAMTQGGAFSSEGPQLAAGFGVKLFRDHTLDYAFQPSVTASESTGDAGFHFVTLTFRFTPVVKPTKRLILDGSRVIEVEDR